MALEFFTMFISALSLQENYNCTVTEKQVGESFLSLLVPTPFITTWFPKIQTRRGQ